MTHFDFKCLLPALLHIEDRMSMAHGLESRVPLLDHALVEFAATVPADVKFRDGHMKHLLRTAFAELLPREIVERRDKMGFPVPLNEWFSGPLRDWLADIFHGTRARHREFVNSEAVLANFDKAGRFSRKIWGLLSLEIWQQRFHDREQEFRNLIASVPRARAPRLMLGLGPGS
jgi:asparagine synthase (glutamine-hydrolysing)